MRSNHLQDGRHGERVEKLRIFEDGQGSDRIVLQRQKLNRVSPPFGTRLRAAIHGESRLQVSGCRDETKAAVGSPGPSEEGPNRLAPAIPVAPRRHAVDGILAEEHDKFIEIGTLPGSHVAIEQPALPIVRGRLKLGPAAGKSLGQSGASALQGAVDRRRGGLEQTSRFVCRPAHHVAKQKDRPLPRRQVLDHSDEGELHGLAQLVARVWALRRIGNALQAEVAVGFEPSSLAWPAREPACGPDGGPCDSGSTRRALARLAKAFRQALVAIR